MTTATRSHVCAGTNLKRVDKKLRLYKCLGCGARWQVLGETTDGDGQKRLRAEKLKPLSVVKLP